MFLHKVRTHLIVNETATIISFLQNRLGSYVSRNPWKEKMLILGDFNAHIGKKDLEEGDIDRLGEFIGHDTCNENGENLKTFLQIQGMGCYSMRYNKTLLETWSNGRTSSQIDHVIATDCPRKFKIKYIRAGWTELNIDHKLVICGIRMTGNQDKPETKMLATVHASNLQFEETKKKYHEELGKKGTIAVDQMEINEAYFQLMHKLKSAANQALKRTGIPTTPKRKAALRRLRNAQKRARSAKERGMDIITEKTNIDIKRQEYRLAVKAHREKEIFQFFNNLSAFEPGERIKRTHQFLKKYVKTKERTSNTNISMAKWEKELEAVEGEELTIEEDIDEIGTGPTREEIKTIIQKLTNGKAAGTDKLKNEYIRYADDDTTEEMWRIIRKVWETNIIPDEWRKSVQVPIPKKRGAKETADYRRISLCNMGYKIYATWLRERLKLYTGEPGLHQAAFTAGRSTDDQIFIARRVTEERWNAGKITIVASIDLKKAFDRIELYSIHEILQKMNVPHDIIQRICNAINLEKTKIAWQGVNTNEKIKGIGIKQGCPMSPFIFNLVIQHVLTEVKEKMTRLNLLEDGHLKLPIVLAFADDILILTKSKEELETILRFLKEALIKVGLEINAEKSCIVIREPMSDRNIPNEMQLNNDIFPVKPSTKYLGTQLTQCLDRPITTKQRCKDTIKTAKVVIEFMKRYKPPWSLGKLIYKTVISPAITYGNKTATILKSNRFSMARYEHQIVREIWEHSRNRPAREVSVANLLEGQTAVKRTRVQRICYWGHIQRRPRNHPLKTAMELKTSRRKLGRPAYTWNDTVKKDMEKMPEVDINTWKTLAKDKENLKRKAEEIYKVYCSEDDEEKIFQTIRKRKT